MTLLGFYQGFTVSYLDPTKVLLSVVECQIVVEGEILMMDVLFSHRADTPPPAYVILIACSLPLKKHNYVC